ncbi:hypothetical protein OJ997_21120 [Solirubrobacter phytolaccae]|uniref:DUF4267 domain-containing protein n=1 Tax=Solirubrobacter phytolaccae TaxID=1404360 RepID=A0A9X3NDF5_9ACTN|nr:hypothetical protein [Solirubrobacter phytolaccae]MDA0182827.1 hypothetical protein [Solirubrobacter phytolaccae]
MKRAAIGILGFRVLYGAGLLLAPDKITKSWLGPLDDPARVALRALGAREIVLHALAIGAVLDDKPLKPLLAASIAGDVSDVVSTVLGKSGLPDGAAPKTAAVAGGSAVLTALLLRA